MPDFSSAFRVCFKCKNRAHRTADHPNEPEPNLLWYEVVATYLCPCGNTGDGELIDDCTLPSRFTCDACGRVFKLQLVFDEVF